MRRMMIEGIDNDGDGMTIIDVVVVG